MIALYGIKTCDTCRKALKLLEGTGRDVRFVDVRATPLSDDKLTQLLASLGDDLLNTRSTTWRGLSEAERAQPVADLLRANPTLMKRPVIETPDALYLGWSKTTQATLL